MQLKGIIPSDMTQQPLSTDKQRSVGGGEGLNLGYSACKADVITTALRELRQTRNLIVIAQ